MRFVLVFLLAIVASPAIADPTTTRVVLADPDPELRSALVDSLVAWRIEVIVVAAVPKSTHEADGQARASDARFVVWRRGGDLVVFDRERGSAEYREGSVGSLDGPGAAAAALTVKTLMRLPKPVVSDPAPRVVAGPTLRVQTGVASRAAHGSTTELGARVALAGFVRPWRSRMLRFGIAGEVGTSASVEVAGFKGTWSDWNVIALASWSHAFGRWELEPHVGVGVARSAFVGREASMERDEADAVLVLRTGAWLRRSLGPWSIGAVLAIDAAPSTPTYTKEPSNQVVFNVPTVAVMIGAIVAVDFR
ncbi:MAG: hypothetical protein ABI867_43975 [Kofleriaceae bacterium]